MLPIHRWRLTENANDSVGTLNLTNNGTVTFSADGALFNASTKWLSCTLPTRTVGSWAAWIKPTGYPATNSHLFAFRTNGVAGGYWQGMGGQSDGILRFTFNPVGANSALGYYSPHYVPTTKHSLLVYTFDANYIKGYLNGKLIAQETHTPSLSNIGTSFGIGAYGGNNYDAPNWNFKGYIRDFMEFDYVLPPKHIKVLLQEKQAINMHNCILPSAQSVGW